MTVTVDGPIRLGDAEELEPHGIARGSRLGSNPPRASILISGTAGMLKPCDSSGLFFRGVFASVT
jgi:hypothetical protein